ncbi:septin-5-like [Sardina pilchardus]|uniref:septin-5-like n=1 Tax=Sardina pilchardus TaxID=27697 RepID=UPI002E0D55C2
MAYLNIDLTSLPQRQSGNCICYTLNTKREYLNEKEWKHHDGSPASNDAKIRQWTFGKEIENKINKTILLAGETGTGKTTLIHTMVNYMLGVKFEDKVWFELAEEEEKGQTLSKTLAVTVYKIHIEEQESSFTIIDTPGYGDTQSEDNGEAIAENLSELFESYGKIERIDTVGLVVKSSANRLTKSQRYIFDSILSLFGKDIEDNIVLLITHSDGLPPTNAIDAVKMANARCAKGDDGEPTHFLFNSRQLALGDGFPVAGESKIY